MGTRHNVRYNLRSENNEVPRYCISIQYEGAEEEDYF